MSNEKDAKSNFSKFSYDILRNYDDKYIAVLSVIASLARTKGYCYASNEYFFDNMYKMNKRKLSTRLDYLEENNLIVRYFQINKDMDKNFRAKRIIVLTNLSYESYKSIDSNTKKPVHVPSNWLTINEYNERLGTHKKEDISNNNKDLFIEKGTNNEVIEVSVMEDNSDDTMDEQLNEYDELDEFMKT